MDPPGTWQSCLPRGHSVLSTAAIHELFVQPFSCNTPGNSPKLYGSPAAQWIHPVVAFTGWGRQLVWRGFFSVQHNAKTHWYVNRSRMCYWNAGKTLAYYLGFCLARIASWQNKNIVSKSDLGPKSKNPVHHVHLYIQQSLVHPCTPVNPAEPCTSLSRQNH